MAPALLLLCMDMWMSKRIAMNMSASETEIPREGEFSMRTSKVLAMAAACVLLAAMSAWAQGQSGQSSASTSGQASASATSQAGGTSSNQSSASTGQASTSSQTQTDNAPPEPPDDGPGFGPGGPGMGMAPPRFDASEIFSRLDTNKDGQISKEEFQNFGPPARDRDRSNRDAGRDGGRDRSNRNNNRDRAGNNPGANPGGDMMSRMREGMLSRLKEELGCTDEEWTLVQPRLEKVMTLQFSQMSSRMRMGGPRGGPMRMNEQSNQPEAAAVRKAVDDKGTKSEDIQKKVEALRAARKKQLAELDAARAQLREILTPRQEAALILNGILD